MTNVTFETDPPIEIFIKIGEAQAMMDFARALIATAATAKIEGEEEYRQVAELGTTLKGYADALKAAQLEQTRPINAARDTVIGHYRSVTADLETSMKAIREGLGAYGRRVEQEARARQAREEQKAREDRERLEAAARTHEDAGEHEMADAAREVAAQTFAPIVPTTPHGGGTRVAGTSTREDWKCEVTHPERVPAQFLMVDMAKLGAHVRAHKGSLLDAAGDSKIPGVKIWNAASVGLSAKRAGKA